ncbi:hypothetical protein R1sor_012796 [Riccia sorocarpa]|uniref:Alfin N-terminal domain-containing protein n=1 Tax=Riccia sorocarpa TaxID=122646 RepID=A0ABD3I8J6_9MARC
MEPGSGNGDAAAAEDENVVSPVEHIFRHIFNRRIGIVKALTVDFDKFFAECDPDKENLCLYGLGNGKWVVGLPEEKVPSEFPEPAVGINFTRDGMPVNQWLNFVALHSDAWLFGLAAFYTALHEVSERKRLFCMLCDVPSVYDVVTGKAAPFSTKCSTPIFKEPNVEAVVVNGTKKRVRFEDNTCQELSLFNGLCANDPESSNKTDMMVMDQREGSRCGMFQLNQALGSEATAIIECMFTD